MKKRLQGTVTGDRMDKSIVVKVMRRLRHQHYGKHLRKHSTMMAHDPHNEARSGDTVEIEETRPLSKHKCWRLVRILRRAAVLAGDASGAHSAQESDS